MIFLYSQNHRKYISTYPLFSDIGVAFQITILGLVEGKVKETVEGNV